MTASLDIGHKERLTSASPSIEAQANWMPLAPVTINIARRNPKRAIRDKYQVTRRLNGILLNLEGPEARVIFDSKDGPIEYLLPSRVLLGAGIKIPNQPFEYSELEVTHADGTKDCFPEILAMAPASSAAVKNLPLGSELIAKRERVLKYFAERT